jgi:hypothetical protein
MSATCENYSNITQCHYNGTQIDADVMYAKFAVLIAMKFQVMVLWVMTLRSDVGELCCLTHVH